MQVLAVVLLTFGVVGAAMADAEAQGRSIDLSYDYNGKSATTFFTGFTILALAMLLSAFQGVYVDRLYAQHGNTHWREALLYSHMLSLPFFLPTYPQLTSQFRTLMSSPPILSTLSSVFSDNDLFRQNATTSLAHLGSVTSHSVTPTSTAVVAAASQLVPRFQQHGGAVSWFLSRGPGHYFVRYVLAQTPSKVFFLLVNALTQYICIRGVYLLAAKSSSLTVTIVLNIRKLVSLLFSIYLFGNSLATGVLLGAGFVFLGGALYGVEGARLKNKKARHAQQNADVSNKIKV
jgi:UDP-xylose/UDP-N-acetylglucosamine transporter B4